METREIVQRHKPALLRD